MKNTRTIKKIKTKPYPYWLAIVLLAAIGCQPAVPSPVNALQQIDPQKIVGRGQIRFVTDSSLGCQLAKQQGMPCLLFFTAEWCTFCHQMEETAFADPEIGKLAKSFVCVLVDADREPKFCEEYGIEGFPTVQFLAADGRRLRRLVGRQSTPDLKSGMLAALERMAWLGSTKSL